MCAVWGGGALGGGRCRGGAGSASGGKKPRRRVASVAQRRAANIRERRRMFNLNEAFDKLRRKVSVSLIYNQANGQNDEIRDRTRGISQVDTQAWKK